MLYIITMYDEVTEEVKIHSVIKDDYELAEDIFNKKVRESEASKSQSKMCELCPIYSLSIAEDEAIKLAKHCKKFDFDEENFDCFNVDNGVEAKRRYFLHKIDMKF